MTDDTPKPTDPAKPDPWREAACYALAAIHVAGTEADPTPVVDLVLSAFAALRAEHEAVVRERDVLKEATRWRDVKTEPLPEKERDVLLNFLGDTFIGSLDKRESRWNVDRWMPCGVEKGKVTHWMPLPEPPIPAQEPQ